MDKSSILSQAKHHMVRGAYNVSPQGFTTIKTLDSVTVLSYGADTITFYVPLYNPNICETVTARKYGDYKISDISVEQLGRILFLFKTRLDKCRKKFNKDHEDN